MIACRRWRCPACGFFGRGAARRAQTWADRAHIAWAAGLAAASRRRRSDDDGLISVTDCRVLEPGDPGYRYGHMLLQARAAQDAELEAYDTDDVVAEVIGDLSYEEQSTMIGDPIADKIIEETP